MKVGVREIVVHVGEGIRESLTRCLGKIKDKAKL